MSVWFGGLVYWLIQNRHGEHMFASNRITVADGRVSHTFRYAITEAEHNDMLVADIKQMKIHSGEPIAIELFGERDGDFLILPNMAAVARLEAALLKHNPNIAIAK